MKTPNQILIDFMRYKSCAVAFATKNFKDILFTKKDAEDIRKWPNEFVKNVVNEMEAYITDTFLLPITDIELCPYCLKYSLICGNCCYAKNHKFCSNLESTYEKITKEGAICDLPIDFQEILDFAHMEA